MKTIKQWLKERLSEEDYKKAEKYKNRYWEAERDYFENALWGAFIWGNTREGYNYWRKIYDNEGSLQNNNTEQMKTIKQWLKEYLSEEDYNKAKKYKCEVWKVKTYSFRNALDEAFSWDETQEDEDYWLEIYENGGSLQPDPTDMKLTVDPKFIKRIHELSSPEVKQQLEQEFPSLILNLEKGVWYNYGENLLCHMGNKDYGFWDGEWAEGWSLGAGEPDKIKVATEEEVRDALIKEAKKRGYKTGNFVCLSFGLTSESVDDHDKWTFMGDSLYTKGRGLGGDAVYRDGKWAELISTTFTLEEAREFIAKIRGVAKEEIVIETN